ncbi:hypothetical protein N7492_008183 [Penicillium capsulatum]|uniref:Uncharacterized protein n=1 Tax=Penicillium capsulatum TaxID=69766 RepID=A0A9W9LH36_9EURO|nr:hypothetical protein N7492_008183 [Penicillium capsulatum]KAJ6105593.1 hypothetical protein N7512_009110 [Penicillium capsulatum]
MRSATFLPLILLVLPQYVNGWYLDQSCHKPKRSFGPPGAPEYLDDMSGMVMKAVANAFDMAETAQNSLEFLRQGMGSEQEMKLVKDMFAFAVRNEKLQQSEYLNFVAGVLSEIVAFDQNEGKPSPQPQTLPPNEMIVFCDFTRFKENHDCIHDAEGNACDTAVNGPLVMIDVYKECRDGFRWKDGQPIQDEPSQTDVSDAKASSDVLMASTVNIG